MPRTANTQTATQGKAATQTLTIRVDTREQDPFTFVSVNKPVLPFSIIRGTLPTGDYADDGRITLPPAEQAVVERKSLADLYKTMGKGRDRFEREMERGAEYGFFAVVIEASWTEIADPNWHLPHATLMSPKSVINSLLAFEERYGVHVWACPGRRFAEQITHRILERWARDHG